jgi:hypothetical protein
VNSHLKNLQNLPERQKKIVLWAIVVILGIIMLGFWIKGTAAWFNSLGQSFSQFKIPEVKVDRSLLLTTSPSDGDLAQNNSEVSGWQIYDSGKGFYFKYPAEFKISSPTSNKIVVDDPAGQEVLSVKAKASSLSLEEDVINQVAAEKEASRDAAAPVSVNYAGHKIGSLNGYLISIKAGDVLENTTEIFKVKEGDQIISFVYSYPGYIFGKKPEGDSAKTKEFQEKLKSDTQAYAQIQTMISTFNFIK